MEASIRGLAREGKPLTFPDRQYSIPGASADIVRSARKLNELLAPLQQAKVAMRLFLRGMADKRQVDKASTRPAGIIAVLPQTNGIHSGTRTETLPVVDNEALPNLRAEWMRQQLRPVMSSVGTRDIEILDNQPSDGSELAVDLLLFVDWR